MTSDFNKTALEQIEGDFWYASYDKYKVIMKKSNSWINVTQLDKDITKMHPNDCSRESYINWMYDRTAKGTAREIMRRQGYSPETESLWGTISEYVESPDKVKGMYVHSDLIPNFISWCNDDFSLEANRIVNEHYINKYLEKREKREKHENARREKREKDENASKRVKLDDSDDSLGSYDSDDDVTYRPGELRELMLKGMLRFQDSFRGSLNKK
jgi:hypothetical protein